MEIQNSNEIGISVVGDFTIRYTIKKDAEGTPTEVMATVVKKTANVIATYNCRANGVMGFSINEESDMTASERKAIINQMLDDTAETFGWEYDESAPTTEE